MRVFLFLIVFFVSKNLSAQFTCDSAYQYCGNSYTMPLNTNVPDLGPMDCLSTAPNPTWFYFAIDQNGEVNIEVTGTTALGSAIDIDVVVFGPFGPNDCEAVVDSLAGGAVFCDYSTSNISNVNFPNAFSSQYYYMVVTNFSNNEGEITITDLDTTGVIFDNCQTEVSEQKLDFNQIKIQNPFIDFVKLEGLPEENYQLFIYDLSGRKVFDHQNNLTELNLDLSFLNQGIYVFELNTFDLVRKTTKILKY